MIYMVYSLVKAYWALWILDPGHPSESCAPAEAPPALAAAPRRDPVAWASGFAHRPLSSSFLGITLLEDSFKYEP